MSDDPTVEFPYLVEETSAPDDSTNGDRPPKARARGRVSTTDKLISDIEGFYGIIGLSLTAYPKASFDGMLIAQSAQQLAESWRDPIDRNPKIKKLWAKVFQASGYGALISAHMAIAIPILQHHRIIPSAMEPQRNESESANSDMEQE